MMDPDGAARAPTSPGSAGLERSCPAEDWRLVQEILQGSIPAWHDFVVRYTGLIRSALRRLLYTADTDDLRAVYTDVLTHLYHGGFAAYEGRCSLATWVALAARARAMDFLRARFGRRELPAGYDALSPEDRQVFRLYYLEGLSLAEVQQRLAAARGDAGAVRLHGAGDGAGRGHGADHGGNGHGRRRDPLHELVEALQRIEEAVGPRALQRCTDEAAARSVGIGAARLLQYLEHARREAVQQQQAHTPEAVALQREVDEARRMVRQLVRRLPDEDRLAVQLWFFRDWAAEDLTRAIGLPNRRKAYTVVQRGLRRLRRLMLDAGYDPRERVLARAPAVAPEESTGP